MNTQTAAKPARVFIKPDVNDTLSKDLVNESLARQEVERERVRRDLLLYELAEETERLGLYKTPLAAAH